MFNGAAQSTKGGSCDAPPRYALEGLPGNGHRSRIIADPVVELRVAGIGEVVAEIADGCRAELRNVVARDQRRARRAVDRAAISTVVHPRAVRHDEPRGRTGEVVREPDRDQPAELLEHRDAPAVLL